MTSDTVAHSVPIRNSGARRRRWFVVSLLFAFAVLGIAWFFAKFRIAPLEAASPFFTRVQTVSSGETMIEYPPAMFVSTVATFDDELFAYLMYQHYGVTKDFAGEQLLLRYNPAASERKYEVLVVLGSDLIASIDRIAELAETRQVEGFAWRLTAKPSLSRYQNETKLFISAYNLPVRKKMEDLSKTELRSLLRRFIQFKSTTDPRVRKRLEAAPDVLTAGRAQQLAGDIIAVSEFYDLPLEFLLGIGAMENNYMNVRGDLTHSIWKRRPAKDDIVLERRRGRVRVLNDSAGVWQITRETLRSVHKLYLADHRDYTKLPEHLRPPKQLDIDNVSPDVLTTYAGLLLRQLLDDFHGDVGMAIGAYNGGPRNPNKRYEEGVRGVALQARSILERAAALNGESVLQMNWVR